jgi:hypothetical protein
VLQCHHLYSAFFFSLFLIELARDALNSKDYCVIGGYMSPVNDAYKKKVCRCLTKTEKNPCFIISIHISGKLVRKSNHWIRKIHARHVGNTEV